MKRIVVLAAWISLVVWIAIGCKDKNPQQPIGEDWPSVQLIFLPDTERYFSGDTAVVLGFVQIRHSDGSPVPGAVVTLSLSSGSAWIEWADLSLRDTTDAGGRAGFRLLVTSGDSVTIHALAVGRADHAILRLNFVSLGFLNITVDPDTLHHPISPPQVEDSIHVTVTLQDTAHVPVPDALLTFYAGSGRLGLFPRTDSAGVTRGSWYLTSVGGRECITVSAGLLRDTACVVVDSLP